MFSYRLIENAKTTKHWYLSMMVHDIGQVQVKVLS
jgi:hypothetical protein